MSIIQTIEQEKIVPIIRSSDKTQLQQVIESLYAGGARVLEVTMNTPGALAAIEWAKATHSDLHIGAGTVLDAESARTAILSGAEFLLAPTLDAKTIETGSRYGVPVIPGVLTPTEILQATEAGAEMVKIFPIRAFGASYLKDVHGPLPHVRAMAVGGVSLDNMQQYLQHGWHAVGLGSQVVDPKAMERGDMKQLTRNMEQARAILREGGGDQ
ncbi:bifunctional 4-hydroxy-2-oxoglutarate aldolase/2-dehydro-3-deoxy-phosphogluconate aldolase [Marinococcus halotolerans]|uniref:bifunctional 4-hydroxy-2-oxoglutarate aldolase/2-dehydro-3-deoxy-phosphogluconate aldolase n=1 Tax=Marinococcus halotolerans TaxID=301092 RepID=UPI0003B43436|nr:bifunctional 4-hydroxy-2-oxoglutarate aldolase/2-dehydro-3-deoxy-phosphogluconate aldolase [Marinococcus halotolerans]